MRTRSEKKAAKPELTIQGGRYSMNIEIRSSQLRLTEWRSTPACSQSTKKGSVVLSGIFGKLYVDLLLCASPQSST